MIFEVETTVLTHKHEAVKNDKGGFQLTRAHTFDQYFGQFFDIESRLNYKIRNR